MHTIAESRAHGLGRRFLGGKTACEKICFVGILVELQQLRRCEYALDKSVAEAADVIPYAFHAHDVGANAENHIAAIEISRFISRTASLIPVNSARAMMACPILRSEMPGMEAMA